MHELVIAGKLWLGDRFDQGALGIDGGTITAIKKELSGHRILDYGQRWVLPGLVDLHVHFREPGHTWKEDFATGTGAAALGGVTTVFDMPNTDPPTTTRQRLVEKRALVEPKALVDFGLIGGLTDGTEGGGIEQVASALKVYCGVSTGGLLVTADHLPAAAAVSGELPLVVHAEDQRVLDDAAKTTTTMDLPSHDAARPVRAETAAIDEVLRARPRRVHVAHLSSAHSIEALQRAGATFEVTPSHLLLHHDMTALGTEAKVNPPLRSREERDGLWAAYVRGRCPILASDHAPHTAAEKGQPFGAAPSGIPGVQTMGPLFLRLLKRNRLDPAVVLPSLTSAPADAFGLPKGRLLVGRDADVCVVDPAIWRTVRSADLHAKGRLLTPFEGLEQTPPRQVFLRGQRLVEDGVLHDGRVNGRFLRAGPAAAPSAAP